MCTPVNLHALRVVHDPPKLLWEAKQISVGVSQFGCWVGWNSRHVESGKKLADFLIRYFVSMELHTILTTRHKSRTCLAADWLKILQEHATCTRSQSLSTFNAFRLCVVCWCPGISRRYNLYRLKFVLQSVRLRSCHWMHCASLRPDHTCNFWDNFCRTSLQIARVKQLRFRRDF